MPKVELHIGALPIHVRTARLVAASLGRRIGLDAIAIDEVKLAVGEACSRAVSVNHAAGAREPVVVQFRDDDDVLEVSVMDCGPSGTQLPSAAAAEAVYGEVYESYEAYEGERLAPGIGLAMIAGLVDDVTIEDRSAEVGTVVTMRWPIVTF